MDKAKKYLEANDNSNGYLDSQSERISSVARDDIAGLMYSPNGRNSELWDEIGVDPDVTVDDYSSEENKNLEWMIGLSALASVSLIQFVLDNRDELLTKPLAYRKQLLDNVSVDFDDLILAAKRIPKTDAGEAFSSIKSGYLKMFEPISKMDSKELYLYLRELDAIKPSDILIGENMSLAARAALFSDFSQIKNAVDLMINRAATIELGNTSRRMLERLSSYDQTDGDMSTLMVWVGEGGPNACQNCTDRYGRVETYSEWVIIGQPGAGVCAGGDRCRCHLATA